MTIYIANNGVHADIVMPVKAQGLDWAPILPRSDFASPSPDAQWVAFGSGEKRVYLETPRWRDIRPRTVWAALTGGKRVMHVEWVSNPYYGPRRSASGRKNIAACGPRSAPSSSWTPTAGRSASTIRATDRRCFLPGNRQVQRAQDLQHLGATG